MVVAGAGSGKTLTILGKIKYLLESKECSQEEILCISFTNKSCDSLSEKLKNIGYSIDVLTFHKLGLKVLDKKNLRIAPDDLLDFIIDEYFKSLIRYSKKRLKEFKRLFFSEKKFDKIVLSKDFKELKITIRTFIALCKANAFDLTDLLNFYRSSYFQEKKILKYIIEIYLIYHDELRSQEMVDFDDMILLATDKIKDIDLPYRFIIIDEFQDTSIVRLNLIKSIIEKYNANIFVVGDDWQSIYRFSGCNLDIFLNFEDYFEKSKIFALNRTYRNSQELIDLSANFILKNKKQLKKEIYSEKHLVKPIRIYLRYSLYELLKTITGDYLILARYNDELKDIDDEAAMTIHKSKGLEADNVILINAENTPSMKKNERIMRFVLNEREYIPFEEERRLFYVALTRTKNRIYLLCNNLDSPFLKELLKNYSRYIEIYKK